MVKYRVMLTIACATAGLSTAAAGQFFSPNPEVFAREEDRGRAYLLGKACAQADVGRGCYRSFDGRTLRETPCAYHIDAQTIGLSPTDQCYKMEAPRRYRGVWIDAFEGQSFIPEGATAPEWPRGDPKSTEWKKQFDRALAATIWLDVERVNVGHKWQQGSRRMLIEFVGRKTMYLGHYGHMGMSGHEIIVDRVVSITECRETSACG